MQEHPRPVILAADNMKALDALKSIRHLFDRHPQIIPFVSEIKVNHLLWGADALWFLQEIRRFLESSHLWPRIGFFLDLKLADIGDTNVNVLSRYRDFCPLRVTFAGIISFRAVLQLHELNPYTSLSLFIVPTDMDVLEVMRVWKTSPENVITRFLQQFEDLLEMENPINSCICSGQELTALRDRFGKRYQLVVPGIRSSWMGNQNQRRVMTPRKALRLGADRIVLGSQLFFGNPGASYL